MSDDEKARQTKRFGRDQRIEPVVLRNDLKPIIHRDENGRPVATSSKELSAVARFIEHLERSAGSEGVWVDADECADLASDLRKATGLEILKGANDER